MAPVGVDHSADAPAGMATHAKRAGMTKIFYDFDPPQPFVPKQALSGKYESTPDLLSWLPPLADGSYERSGPLRADERPQGKRHIAQPGRDRSILQHDEPPPRQPAHTRRRVGPGRGRPRGLDPRSSGEVGAFTKATPADRYAAKVVASRHSPARQAAPLLPPIHGRAQPAEARRHEPPAWGVKQSRKPFIVA